MENALKLLLRRDRVILLAGLLAIALLSWIWMVRMAAMMELSPIDAAGVPGGAWGWGEVFALFVMWWVMMVAMMTPSAVPAALVFVAVHRKRREHGLAWTSAAFFVCGYHLAWAIFSLGAALLQQVLHNASLLSPTMESSSPLLGAAILAIAGVFQWTAPKDQCLRHCRNPVSLLAEHWREGAWGATRMGVRHGWYCVGCCSALMCVLFVTGVMNLLWVALIAIFVLVEKLAPLSAQPSISRAAGLALIGWAVLLWIRAA